MDEKGFGTEEKQVAARSSTLPCKAKWGYGFGHILNDMMASMWFSYALLFYKLSYGKNAYAFVVIGQAVDAVATTVFAVMVSQWNPTNRLFALGKYTTWYIFGTVHLLITFPLAFSEVSLFFSRTTVFIIYVLAILFSQVGWSFAQISHLSLINCISSNSSDRIWLTSVRQAASIYAAIVVYVLFWYSLHQTGTDFLCTADIYIFSNNAFFVTLLGLFHSVIFLLTVNEPRLIRDKLECLTRSTLKLNRSQQTYLRKLDSYGRLDWFKDILFFKITFIYMFSRLYLNLPTTYIPLYLQETLYLEKISIAVIPLIVFLSGLAMSLGATSIENRFGNKFHLTLGVVVGLIASGWISLGSCQNESFGTWQIYLVACLIGVATTIVKIASISLVADMIGQNTQSISFIYGTVGCFEKVLGGLTIGVLEQFNHDHTIDPVCPHYQMGFDNISPNASLFCPNGKLPNMFYYYIMSYGNAIVLLMILLGLFCIINIDLNKPE